MKEKHYKPASEQIKKIAAIAAEKPGLMEYAHHVGSFSIEKLNVEEMKSTALQAMHQQTEIQVNQIYEQIELLAKQAQKIKERSDVSRKIYKAKIGFKTSVGQTYYLYENKEGKEILSMIAPNEWGKEFDFIFIAQVKLLADHTWFVES